MKEWKREKRKVKKENAGRKRIIIFYHCIEEIEDILFLEVLRHNKFP